MKKGVSTLMLALSVLISQAQTEFFEGSWKEAFNEAKKQDKFLFVDCYTDWCGWCKVADEKTFPNRKVAAVLNDHFVSVKVDMEKGIGVDLAQKYRVTGFPSYLIFAPDGSFSNKMFGYNENAEEFAVLVKKSMEPTSWPSYPSKLTDAIEFPEFYKNAFHDKDSKEKRVNPKQEVVEEWLASQKDLFSEEAWSVMYRFPLSESNTKVFLSNLKGYSKLYEKKEVLEVVGRIAGEKLELAIETRSTQNLDTALSFVDKYISEDTEETKARFRLRFFEGIEDWFGYVKSAQSMIDRHGIKNHIDGANNYSWTLYEKATDSEVLNTAIDWMTQVVNLDPQYMYVDTYAALLFKQKRYEEALKWAGKAIATGKKNGDNVEETEKLLNQIISAQSEK